MVYLMILPSECRTRQEGHTTAQQAMQELAAVPVRRRMPQGSGKTAGNLAAVQTAGKTAAAW